ncbi:ABC transporter substrate-binding protein [Lachnospiraceae bacterium HCP1S3_A8]
MAAALAVGMTACSSQNNSQTTAAGTAAESQSSGAAGAESGASERAAESNAEASDAKAGDADQGYYKEAGLDVEIIEPTEGATATLIAVGKGDFGISYQEDVTIALTSKDPLPIKTIATLIQHNISGFEALKGKVDIEWFFEGWDNVKCKLNNFPINYMELRQLDDRLDYYTPVIIANQDTLEQKPEMVITEQNRSRDWLYSQEELRQKIYRQIMGEKTEV